MILQHLFGFTDGAMLLALDVALHFGTLLAVLFALRREILKMRFRDYGLVGLATIPAVVVGLGFKDWIERFFVSPKVAGWGLLITGVVLWLTKYSHGSQKPLEGRWSLLIGCAQAVAILPGISRSGSTIAAGIFLGVAQLEAARFSFLMSIPAILGSVVLEGRELSALPQGMIGAVALGTAASAVTGFLAIRTLLKIISRERLYLFSYYCWGVGLLTLLTIS